MADPYGMDFGEAGRGSSPTGRQDAPGGSQEEQSYQATGLATGPDSEAYNFA